MTKHVLKMLPTVPETLVKHRKKHENIRQARIAAQKANIMLRKDKLKDIFKHAEQYVKKYWQKERDEIRLKRKQRSPKTFSSLISPSLRSSSE